MKKKKWLAVAVPLGLCCVLCVVYMAVFVWSADRTPPRITMDSEELSLSVEDGAEALLQGVRAQDDRDGDVTAGIVVESVSPLSGEDTATVTYAAFDSAGNVAKASRMLRYTDYTAPVLGLKGPLVFREGNTPDVLGVISAKDVIDGDISDRVKGTLVSESSGLNYAGTHQVQFRVTNSMGDTSTLTLPVDVLPAAELGATVKLSKYLVRIKSGEEFDADSYVRTATVGGTDYNLRRWSYDYVLEVNDEEVNTEVPGIYSVTYEVTVYHGGGTYAGFSRLHVIVEEA